MQEGRNVKLDDLAAFLANFDNIAKTSLQFPREVFTGVDLSFKLDVDEDNLLLDPYDGDGWDYASITLYGREGFSESSGTYHYFIKSYEWASQRCIRFVCKMDVLNTILPLLSFTAKTITKRQHKARYTHFNAGTQTANRVIDRFDEGIKPMLFKSVDRTLEENSSRAEWNLVYRNANIPDATDFYQINPVECHMTTDSNITVASTTNQWTDTDFPDEYGNAYFFTADVGMTIQGGGNEWVATALDRVVAIVKNSDGSLSLYTVNGTVGNQPLTLRGLVLTSKVLTVSDNSSPNFSVYNVAANDGVPYPRPTPNFTLYVDAVPASIVGIRDPAYPRNDSRLIKIIKLPYAPADITYDSATQRFTIPNEWDYSSEWSDLKLQNVNARFTWRSLAFADYGNPITDSVVVTFPTPPTAGQARAAENESKLLNSNFHTCKIAYDSFSIEVPLELFRSDINPGTVKSVLGTSTLYVRYAVSSTFSGNMLFSINGASYCFDSFEDYPYTVTVARNNQEPIYTSAYLDYIRTGYNYEVKSKGIQAANSAIGIGAGLVGGIAAGAMAGNLPGAIVGGAVGLVSGLLNAITHQINSENSIRQKLQNARMQAASVQGSDDVDLMVEYCRNRLHYIEYDSSKEIKAALFDLFYYYGYACNDTGVPSTDTRLYFNFVQGDADFAKNKNVPPALIEFVVEKFAEGVTYVHKPLGDSGSLFTEYENWETSLINP